MLEPIPFAGMMEIDEPVAWMDDFGNVFECKNKLFYIPLYTHPVKELTDEEIWEIHKASVKNVTSTNSYRDWVFDEIGFARAILRKAQEK